MGSHSTNEYCGDGTTTSTVIANSIFEQGTKFIKSGHNPILMKRGIEKAKKLIIEYFEDVKFEFDYKTPVRLN